MKSYRNLSRQERDSLREVLVNFGFDLSKVSLRKNLVGYVNKTYLITTKGKKFILRESFVEKKFDHLEFEIEVLQYLHKKKFPLTLYVIPNKSGKYITIAQNKYYLLFNFMPGSIRVSWNNLDRFTDKKLVSYFEASARFTKALIQFRPKTKFTNRPLFFYLKNPEKLFKAQLKKLPKTKVTKMIMSRQDKLYKFAHQTAEELKKLKYDEYPKQAVHFDFHPGNVNFSGDKVTGIFDFDWIRMDNRIADFAGTIGQSCYNFKGPKRAIYDKRKVKLGIKAYRQAFGKSKLDEKTEALLLKSVIKGYMFFQLLWVMNWYQYNSSDPHAYEYVDFFSKILLLNDYDKLFE